MLINVLLISIAILGIIIYYIYYIAPKFDPLKKAEELISNDNIDEAIMEYKKALEKHPDDFLIHFKLANLFLKLNETDQAVIHLEKILELDKYNYEVEKLDIEKKLAQAYTIREEHEKAFQLFIDILKLFPVDPEALYHVSFIALGQEEFEIAQKYFNKLAKIKPNDFEIQFGAGICSYQTQSISDAIAFFKAASSQRPNSGITNLALAFSLQRKNDYKQAIEYASKVSDSTNDPHIIFIAKRVQAFLNIQAKKFDDAVKNFEELLTIVKNNDMHEETMMTLYDIGFACVKAERSNYAYDYWNELYAMDKSYKNVQSLVTMLRKEMEMDFKLLKENFDISVIEYVEEWVTKAFPKDFLWNICGLKSDIEINIKDVAVTARISSSKDDGHTSSVHYDYSINLDTFTKLDNENFRIISNRLLGKLGYKVDQILQTYRESDGVDFLAISPEKDKVLVWVRRWSKTKVGEIPLRNFAQAINDIKAKRGVFVTTAELTTGAENSLSNLSKVSVVYPEEVGQMLQGII